MKAISIKKVKIFRSDMMPDIDVDFPTEYRDAVKDYIKQ